MRNFYNYRIIILGLLLYFLEWDHNVQCVFLLWEYVIGYLAIFILSMVIEFSMCLLATRGSILDTDARAPMQHLLYIRLCKYTVEFFVEFFFFQCIIL